MDFSNKTTAYELLLEANRLYSENKTEEAVQIYCEVLKRNPSPAQQQIAEEQLRLLGHTSPSFAASGTAIRRSHDSVRGRSIRPMAPLFPEHIEVSRVGGGTGRYGASVHKKPSSSTSRSKVPLSRVEKHRSQMENIFSSLPAAPKKSPHPALHVMDDGHAEILLKRQEAVTPLPRVVYTQPPPIVAVPLVLSASSAHSPSSSHVASMNEPQRKGETEKEYADRVHKYSIWMEQCKTYPDIDLNTALRLAEKGWTLEQLRLYQQKRKNRYLERRQKFYDERVQRNQSFSGTQYWETLISDRVPLHVYGMGLEVHDGILVRNDLYHWCLENQAGFRCTVPKLRMELVCEKELLGPILSMCRLNQAQQDRGEVAPVKPGERFHISDRMLMHSLDREVPLLFQTYSGVMCWGWVFWYDPYQLSIVLQPDHNPHLENNEMIEVMLFRHAIQSVQEKLPDAWDFYPRLESVSQTDKEQK